MSQTPITIQHQVRIPVRLETAFKVFTKLDPKDFLHSDKLIAPIKRITMLKGEAFDHQGAMQSIEFADGAVITEELLAWVDNRQILYRGTGFSQPLVNWTEYAQASFEFERLGEQTQFTWRYNFYLKPNPLNAVRKLVFETVVVKGIWSYMMTRTLKNVVKVVTLRAQAVQQ